MMRIRLLYHKIDRTIALCYYIAAAAPYTARLALLYKILSIILKDYVLMVVVLVVVGTLYT